MSQHISATIADVLTNSHTRFIAIRPGFLWLCIATLAGAAVFAEGFTVLFSAWTRPEYAHGPLIPVLSAYLFLRQLKTAPRSSPTHSWVGLTVFSLSLMLATLGKLSNIGELVAYAIILWIGGIVLIVFGWKTGRHFWPAVLHLTYMLPLPGVLYYKLTASLQLISSELGVALLRLFSVPVFLDGNIIDLGVTKLHVAEACSGLRYLFPILSFSTVFAVLYKGPTWQKATLLVAAAPIAIAMNAVRIAAAGVIVQHQGKGWLDGATHFFEGWVVFLACILVLFALARTLMLFSSQHTRLTEALDLETDGLLTQAARIRNTRATPALILTAVLTTCAKISWHTFPERHPEAVTRASFHSFPPSLGDWDGTRRTLPQAITETLGADDHHLAIFTKPNVPPVEFFSAWYADQSEGGIHSPEICLPGNGWEIARLERTGTFNRTIIQKGETRMMVIYWFDQRGRKIAWDMAAKFWLLADGIRTGRTDGALIRLTTPIMPDENETEAEERLTGLMGVLLPELPRFVSD